MLQHPSAGLGVFASDGICKPLHVSWWKLPYYRIYKPNDGIVLASFPLQAAITSQTILSDPVLGQTYQELLDIGMARHAHVLAIGGLLCVTLTFVLLRLLYIIHTATATLLQVLWMSAH